MIIIPVFFVFTLSVSSLRGENDNEADYWSLM